jgi:hypothetical protein
MPHSKKYRSVCVQFAPTEFDGLLIEATRHGVRLREYIRQLCGLPRFIKTRLGVVMTSDDEAAFPPRLSTEKAKKLASRVRLSSAELSARGRKAALARWRKNLIADH